MDNIYDNNNNIIGVKPSPTKVMSFYRNNKLSFTDKIITKNMNFTEIKEWDTMEQANEFYEVEE